MTNLADFFIYSYLWDTRNLSLSAIRGYRSALAPVLQQVGLDISNDRDLFALFRGFSRSCPSRLPQVPAWDLSLVLRSLLKPPYEPLHSASIRDVAMKTAFLLALASALGVSEPHGLLAEV